MYDTTTNTLSDTTIKRRFFRFLRYYQIEFEQMDKVFFLGSATCTITNGHLCCYFPQIGKHYGNAVNYKIEYDDPYNVYAKMSRMHNRLIHAFPLAKRSTFLPDLFD